MRYLYLMFTVLFLPALADAHRNAVCDGSKPVRIYLQPQGIVQIKTTEPITGVYPATPQPAGFIAWDKGRPKHIFRMDGSQMTGATDVHVNTMAHECLLTVRVAKSRWDSVVTLTYPATRLQLQASLPPSLRHSPVRQMWFAMWLSNKADAPATVQVTPYQRDLPGWMEGLTVQVQWRYTLPEFEGFTQLITNATAHSITVRPWELDDPHRPIHSVTMTDTLGTASWRPGGELMAGESALLHVVYRKGDR
jgi:hypothetical protein